jgi:arylsulfatase A
MFREEWIPIIKSGKYKNFQLFNLVTDPNQTKNIADDHPQLLKSLKVQLKKINASVMSDGHDWHLK